MNKSISLATGVLLLITGCSMTSNNITKETTTENFIKYDNTKHIIGNKSNSIYTLKHIKSTNNKHDFNVTFYIDKFPYNKEINLCHDISTKKYYKLLSHKNDIKCKGFININRSKLNKDEIVGSYKFQFIEGFTVQENLNKRFYFVKSQSEETDFTFFTDNETSHDLLRNIIKKEYWIHK